jgi:hypothetical protein
MAEALVDNRRARPIDPTSVYERNLLALAREGVYLLSLPCVGTMRSRLDAGYRDLLFQRGYAFYDGPITRERFLAEIRERLGDALLEELGTSVPDRRTSWPLRLLQTWGPRHPSYHLVLLATLGCPVDTFFPPQAPARARGGGLVIGVPRHEQAFARRVTKVWTDRSKSRLDAAAECGLTLNQLVLVAKKLGLETRVRGGRRARTWTFSEDGKRHLPVDWNLRREQCRAMLLRAIQEHPDATRAELKLLEPTVTNWLGRHDKEWYANVLPAPQYRRVGAPPRNDWAAKERELVAAAPAARDRLVGALPPQRTTKAAILRGMGVPGWRNADQLRLMPELLQTLTELLEPRFEYQLRRLRWMIESLTHDGVHITRTELRKYVTLNDEEWNSAPVIGLLIEKGVTFGRPLAVAR